jgi:hypothetical protein
VAVASQARVERGHYPRAAVAIRRLRTRFVAVLVLLVLTFLALAHGGYSPVAWGWSALAFFWLAALALLLRSTLRLSGLEIASLGGLAAFVGWILLSSLWSPSPTQTVLDAERSLVYLGALAAVLLLVRPTDTRPLLAGVWGAISIACGYGLLTRLFPERLGLVDPIAGNRLSEPIGYWNALGLFAAVGVLLALGFAARARTRATRALAGASLPALVLALYFTFSRGGWIALALGVVAALALGPYRLHLVTVAFILSPWPALTVAFASQSAALTSLEASAAAAGQEGRRVAVVLALAAAGSALSVIALAFVERRLRPGGRVRRAYGAALALLVVAALSAVFVRHGSPPTLAARAWDAFSTPAPPPESDLNRRLFNLSGGARIHQWRAAWHDYESHAWLGSGAGSFEQYWLQHRPFPGKVIDAHSLYLETLAELGPLGLVLLLTALGAPLAAALPARRARLAPAAFAAYVAYLGHAAVDWDWEVPAVTLAALLCGASLLAAGRERQRAKRVSIRVRGGLLALALTLAAFALVGLIGNSAVAASRRAAAEADARKAEAEARRATRWAPWSSEPWRLLARAELAQGERETAHGSLLRALAKDRRNWRLWYELALATGGAEQRRALAAAARLNPLAPEIAALRRALRLPRAPPTGRPVSAAVWRAGAVIR